METKYTTLVFIVVASYEYIPSSNRKAPGANDEVGVLLYAPAIW